MENYFDPELGGLRSPTTADSSTPAGSPVCDGIFSDDDQVVKTECSFCVEERAWTQSTRQLREANQEICLVNADEHASLRGRFEEELREKFKEMKHWQAELQKALKECFCLREQISRLRMGIYGGRLPQSEGPDRCEGCKDAALELQKELSDYRRVIEWKKELDYFNDQEVERQKILMEIMNSIIENCKMKYELVTKTNFDLRVSLWHMRCFLEESTYIPSDMRAVRPQGPREEAPP
ncbi:hypothetical protein OSTOST_11979 [Ostertagia ostertagi]